MALLRNHQKDKLKGGQEKINFKVYDSDGNYKINEDKNVLFSTPRQLIPLRKNFLKSYEKPVKRVELPIKLNKINVKNKNANFAAVKDSATDFGWTEYDASNVFPNEVWGVITNDLDQDVKAISANKYMKTTHLGGVSKITLTRIDPGSCLLKSRSPFSLGFNYHIKTSGTEAEYQITIIVKAFLGATEYSYHSKNKEWTEGLGFFAFTKNTKSINKWDKVVFDVEPLDIDTNNDDIDVRVEILLPSQVSDNGTFNSFYIDNAFVGENNSVGSDNSNGDKYIIERKVPDSDKTITAELKLETQVLSNELNDADYFNGQIEGRFRRPRDTADKTLEQIITQEVINDNREYMTLYEGTFFNNNFNHLSLHNKIYIDFGSDFLQEQVSAYIDGMSHKMKSNEYDLKLHIPNQNNDVDSIYNTIIQ